MWIIKSDTRDGIQIYQHYIHFFSTKKIIYLFLIHKICNYTKLGWYYQSKILLELTKIIMIILKQKLYLYVN